MALPVLTAEDVATLRRWGARIAELERQVSALATSDPARELSTAPDDYVVRVPTAGVPGVSQGDTATGTGTVLADDVASFVTCEVYRVSEDGAFHPTGFSKDVYNVVTRDVPGDSWAKVTRDKFGRWAFVETEITASGGTPCLWSGAIFSDSAVSLTTSWADVMGGLTVDLPSRGTYLIAWTINWLSSNDAGDEIEIRARVVDQNGDVVVPDLPVTRQLTSLSLNEQATQSAVWQDLPELSALGYPQRLTLEMKYVSHAALNFLSAFRMRLSAVRLCAYGG